MKLRTRLFASLVAPTALGAALVAAFALASFDRYFRATTQADLAARATALAENVGDWMERGDPSRVALIVRRYGAQRDLWIRVFDAQGRLVATSAPEEDRATRDWRAVPGVAAALGGRPASGTARAINGHDDRMYESRPIVRGGRSLGALRVSRTLASYQREVRGAVGVTAGLLAGALVLCAALSARLSKGIAAPIRAMRDVAVAIGAGTLGRRVDRAARERRDEIGELAVEIDRMSARLERLDAERRAFLANASHELRTPVTNVQATLEALEDGAADDPELRARFLATALAETRRMSRLVEAMLDLGKLEAGASAIEPRRVDVAQLVERTTSALAARFEAAGVAVALGACAAWARGDPERLQQALLNVLDNALKHAPRGSTVHVGMRVADGEVVVDVRDEGPGISAEDAPHVFEQFYTRDRAGAQGGTGLGLAIARRIVEAHGGSVALASTPPGGGAAFELRLPLAPAEPAAAAAPDAELAAAG